MDREWIKQLNPDDKEQKLIDSWIKHNGLDRFKMLFDIVKQSDVELNYDRITECAKYDARVSQWCYKTIRVIEGQLRASILNYKDSYDIIIHAKSLKEDLVLVVGNQNKDMLERFILKSCKSKKQECTCSDFIDKLSLRELIDLFLMLPLEQQSNCAVFGNIEAIKNNLRLINKLRNDISHNHIVVNKTYNNTLDISNVLKILLSYIDDTDMRSRRKNEFNGYGKYIILKTGEHRIIPDYYRIELCE